MNQKKYKQLGQKERDRIFQLKHKGMSNTDIAKTLGRNKSTIGRELRRNTHQKFKKYLPDTAERKAAKRKIQNRKQRYVDKDPKLQKRIIDLLQRGWSPDIIAGRLKQSRRPFGHWEGDRVIYNRHAKVLTTSVERKTWKVVIFKPKDLTAHTQAHGFIRRYRHLPAEARRTMTYDNGREAAAHETVTAAIGMKFYFARTYASWQRGTNENRNGLVRFYLPRDTDLGTVTQDQVKQVENLINNRPMKVLGYQTPNEVFAIEMNKLLKYKRSHD